MGRMAFSFFWAKKREAKTFKPLAEVLKMIGRFHSKGCDGLLSMEEHPVSIRIRWREIEGHVLDVMQKISKNRFWIRVQLILVCKILSFAKHKNNPTTYICKHMRRRSNFLPHHPLRPTSFTRMMHDLRSLVSLSSTKPKAGWAPPMTSQMRTTLSLDVTWHLRWTIFLLTALD